MEVTRSLLAASRGKADRAIGLDPADKYTLCFSLKQAVRNLLHPPLREPTRMAAVTTVGDLLRFGIGAAAPGCEPQESALWVDGAGVNDRDTTTWADDHPGWRENLSHSTAELELDNQQRRVVLTW